MNLYCHIKIRNSIKDGECKEKIMIIYISSRIEDDMLNRACSMHGRVQKCIDIQNLIRKYDGRYNRKLGII